MKTELKGCHVMLQERLSTLSIRCIKSDKLGKQIVMNS